jgi:hypothetical protein
VKLEQDLFVEMRRDGNRLNTTNRQQGNILHRLDTFIARDPSGANDHPLRETGRESEEAQLAVHQNSPNEQIQS